METAPSITDVLLAILNAVIDSPEAMAIIIAFILTLIPGPLRDIARRFIEYIMQKHEIKEQERLDQKAALAVMHAEDVKRNMIKAGVDDAEANSKALDVALETARKYGLFDSDPEAEARVRAKYRELRSARVVE